VIEYTGESVRPSIGDRREHLIYNSLVVMENYRQDVYPANGRPKNDESVMGAME
ncbi:hypothetical protein Tco_0873188, partial [Tanacetum coccineum]